MDGTIHAALASWGNFYLITGAAAATLTGLQFVVQTLVASDAHRTVGGGDPAGIGAFGTPTVVHFTSALLLSSLMCVPWPGYGSLAATLGVMGVGALAYSALVLRLARRQQSYVPVAEDWIFHVILPAAAYAAVLVAAVLFRPGAAAPDFLIAAATLVLLCVGIHNAWDTVTYLTVTVHRAVAPGGEPAPPRRTDSARRRGRRR
jgi:hypothetical protein